jgi:cardiolipin synthase A/B
LFVLYALAAVGTGAHALLHKRDPRSAWAWITVVWLFPLGGALLYFWFGVNRIERRARRELGSAPDRYARAGEPLPDVPGNRVEVRELVRTGRIMSGVPLTAGNHVAPLSNGEEAYPDMLAAIEAAQRTVWLETYIYDADDVGRAFATALAAAQGRGVQVRVLLDGIGQLSWRPGGAALLESHGVRAALFLPPRLWPPMLHGNLRNHHKLLVVDGTRAWMGGMNISERHYVKSAKDPSSDLHFRVEGPVVAQLEVVFADNWRFAAGEPLAAAASVPAPCGTVHCRALTDGPNDAVDRLQLLLLAALSNAHRRVSIMTPYFIPTPELSGALQAAALRGVDIDIVLPKRSDQWWVDGATRRWLEQLAGRSIQVYYRPAPFSHTKLFLMDDYYAIVGSANLDPRSLRLNFELVLEVYDEALVKTLQAHFDEVRGASRQVTDAMLRARPLPIRLCDAALWLFSPYL